MKIAETLSNGGFGPIGNLYKMLLSYGFTLIELIVVIAILAILALIAVPRLAGFQDKAKQANDKELGSIIAHSIQVAIAAGDIQIVADSTAQSVAVTESGGALVYTPTASQLIKTPGATPDYYDATELLAVLQPLVGDHELQFYTTITISIQDDGDVPVTSITYAP